MLYIYYAILAAVFFATLAMSIDKGLWGNTLSVVNIFLSGLIAFGFYMPLARLASDKGGASYTYLLDFLFIWVLYVLAFIILHRLLSGTFSKTRMRFKYPIDTIGGPAMAAVAAWLMMSFVAATLHTAPFEKESFGGVFTDSSRASTLTNPDLAWLSMAEKMLAEDKLGTDNSFSVNTYVSNYNRMREALDKEPSLRVKR